MCRIFCLVHVQRISLTSHSMDEAVKVKWLCPRSLASWSLTGIFEEKLFMSTIWTNVSSDIFQNILSGLADDSRVQQTTVRVSRRQLGSADDSQVQQTTVRVSRRQSGSADDSQVQQTTVRFSRRQSGSADYTAKNPKWRYVGVEWVNLLCVLQCNYSPSSSIRPCRCSVNSNSARRNPSRNTTSSSSNQSWHITSLLRHRTLRLHGMWRISSSMLVWKASGLHQPSK
jgi:hypothetical protein